MISGGLGHVHQWIIAPILVPALTAALLTLLLRHSLIAQRAVTLAALSGVVVIAIVNLAKVADGAILVYRLGDWPQPFGINLVLDRLSAVLVLLTGLLGLGVAVYAASGWDRLGRHFHPLLLFQIMGVNGAFLTGDVFNLFVFFEVMLIASYGLMLHGGGPRRFVAGFHYVTINLVGSTLFLFAVGLIYAVTGTLNMADLAVKLPMVATGDTALLATGILMLMLVFCLKAALVPLQWWLPTAYAAASPPAAAFFMIMTKVGAYALIRFHTLILGPESGPLAGLGQDWIMPAALLTIALGAVGVLGARDLAGLICYIVLWSMGALLVALSLFDEAGISAALYYLIHSTLAGGALFLLLDLVRETRGRAVLDRLEASPGFALQGWLGALFFVAAIAMAGLPPLSGFIGKLLILQAAWGSSFAVSIWAILLLSSIFVIFGLARGGSILFWKSGTVGINALAIAPEKGLGFRLAVTVALLSGTMLLSGFAGPVTRLTAAIAGELLTPERYIAAALGPSKNVQAARP